MKRIVKCWVVIFALAPVLVGCSHKYQIERLNVLTGPLLQNTDTVYVALPIDSRSGIQQIYPKSARQTADAVSKALSGKVAKVSIGNNAEKGTEAVKSAAAGAYSHVVYAVVKNWEDHMTEWSGIPDRIEIKLNLIDIAERRSVDTVTILGKSTWFTFGGDHPQDLLKKPIKKLAKSWLKGK